MVEMPPLELSTAQMIYNAYVTFNEDWRRTHLGASIIGKECSREIWFSFRWARNPDFDGRMLRLFERGHREEGWIAADLVTAGCTVFTEDGEGKQFRLSHWGGHFGGSIDGVVAGIPEAPTAWHLLECKTSNEKRFRKLVKEGVRKSNLQHFAQMQVYMHYMELDRALYICVCKDNDEIYTERVRYDKAFALRMIEKAEQVIESPEPLTKISEDPSWFQCQFCDHRDHCQLGQVEALERNCRTCSFSTPIREGDWICTRYNVALSDDEQRKGCTDHLFIPAMLPGEAIAYTEKPHSIVYVRPDGRRFRDHGLRLEEVEGAK